MLSDVHHLKCSHTSQQKKKKISPRFLHCEDAKTGVLLLYVQLLLKKKQPHGNKKNNYTLLY